MRVQILTRKETILRVKGARPVRDRWSIYSKWLSRGQHRYGAAADWGLLDGCTFVEPGECDWTVHVRRRCSLCQVILTTCFILP